MGAFFLSDTMWARLACYGFAVFLLLACSVEAATVRSFTLNGDIANTWTANGFVVATGCYANSQCFASDTARVGSQVSITSPLTVDIVPNRVYAVSFRARNPLASTQAVQVSLVGSTGTYSLGTVTLAPNQDYLTVSNSSSFASNVTGSVSVRFALASAPNQAIGIDDVVVTVDRCPFGQRISVDTCVAACPGTQVNANGFCVDNCPANQSPDVNNNCRCSNQDLVVRNGTCQLACSSDEVLFDRECVDECPTGFIADNGNTCQLCVPSAQPTITAGPVSYTTTVIDSVSNFNQDPLCADGTNTIECIIQGSRATETAKVDFTITASVTCTRGCPNDQQVYIYSEDYSSQVTVSQEILRLSSLIDSVDSVQNTVTGRALTILTDTSSTILQQLHFEARQDFLQSVQDNKEVICNQVTFGQTENIISPRALQLARDGTSSSTLCGTDDFFDYWYVSSNNSPRRCVCDASVNDFGGNACAAIRAADDALGAVCQPNACFASTGDSTVSILLDVNYAIYGDDDLAATIAAVTSFAGSGFQTRVYDVQRSERPTGVIVTLNVLTSGGVFSSTATESVRNGVRTNTIPLNFPILRADSTTITATPTPLRVTPTPTRTLPAISRTAVPSLSPQNTISDRPVPQSATRSPQPSLISPSNSVSRSSTNTASATFTPRASSPETPTARPSASMLPPRPPVIAVPIPVAVPVEAVEGEGRGESSGVTSYSTYVPPVDEEDPVYYSSDASRLATLALTVLLVALFC